MNQEIKDYVWVETDDPKDNPKTYSTHKEVMEAIGDFNNGFETNYKSISEFNAGEDYMEIMTPLEYTKFLNGKFSILKEQKLLGKLYECQEEIEKVLNKKNDNECAFLIKILIKLVENNLQNKNTFI